MLNSRTVMGRAHGLFRRSTSCWSSMVGKAGDAGEDDHTR